MAGDDWTRAMAPPTASLTLATRVACMLGSLLLLRRRRGLKMGAVSFGEREREEGGGLCWSWKREREEGNVMG